MCSPLIMDRLGNFIFSDALSCFYSYMTFSLTSLIYLGVATTGLFVKSNVLRCFNLPRGRISLILETWLWVKMKTSSTGQAFARCYASIDSIQLWETSRVVMCLKKIARVMSTFGIYAALFRDRSSTFILAKSSGDFDALRKSFNWKYWPGTNRDIKLASLLLYRSTDILLFIFITFFL